MPRELLSSGWQGGVQGSTDSTLLGPDTSPRGLNSALTYGQGGKPLAAKRKGLSLINATPITSSPPIIGQFHYYNIGTSTDYHLLLDNLGRLTTRSITDDTFTSRSTSFTAGEHYPDFAVASDLCFIVNGSDRLKFNGTTVTNFGITRPTVGTMAGAAGAAGNHNGTYELRVTFGNTSTGHESSASDTAAATVVVASQAISWSNVPVSADTQVDVRYLYARNTATQTQFYRVGSIADNSTTTATTSVTDANATTAAPSTTGRSRPPSGAKYLSFHQGRLFVATDTAIYWSDIEDPEAFNDLSTDGVNPSDGQRIMGLASTGEILLIFKEDRVYGIFNGNNPNTWQIRLIDDDFGCMSHRSIVSGDGVTYWWSRQGLCGWDGDAQITNFSTRYYGPITDVFSFAEVARISAAKDETNNRILIAVPSTGSTRADRIVPFNTGMQRFEATYWDPMDAASLGVSYDSDSAPRVYLGGYAGQLFVTESGHDDGVPSGTNRGTFIANSTEMSTFSTLLDSDGATAACVTTGGGLIERKFQVFTTAGVAVGVRRYITSNTATSITVNANVSGLTNGTTYEWVVGGPDFQWDTPWVGDASYKKRYEFLVTTVKGLGYGNAATIDLTFDWEDIGSTKQRTLTTSQVGSVWDVAEWDVSVWDAGEALRDRFRVGRVGFVWRARVRNPYPDEPFGLRALDMSSAGQTRKE